MKKASALQDLRAFLPWQRPVREPLAWWSQGGAWRGRNASGLVFFFPDAPLFPDGFRRLRERVRAALVSAGGNHDCLRFEARRGVGVTGNL